MRQSEIQQKWMGKILEVSQIADELEEQIGRIEKKLAELRARGGSERDISGKAKTIAVKKADLANADLVIGGWTGGSEVTAADILTVGDALKEMSGFLDDIEATTDKVIEAKNQRMQERWGKVKNLAEEIGQKIERNFNKCTDPHTKNQLRKLRETRLVGIKGEMTAWESRPHVDGKEMETVFRDLQAVEDLVKYPGNPYKDMSGTRLAEAMDKETIAVVRASYFDDCVSKKMRFEDRAQIEKKCFMKGTAAREMWKKHGAKRMVTFCYTWQPTRAEPYHPDPDLFHLQRMIKILGELKQCPWFQCEKEEGKEAEIGVILDYCSLWQKGGDEEDKRSEKQIAQAKEGIKEFHYLYSHAEVLAVKLTAVPEKSKRIFAERGWTLFESLLMDWKLPSTKIDGGKRGKLNCLATKPDFNPKFGNKGNLFIENLAYQGTKRSPPMTPDRFKEALEDRNFDAQRNDVPLFTERSDKAMLIDKYEMLFQDWKHAIKYDFSSMDWTDDDVGLFLDFLSYCKDLQTLLLNQNKIGDAGAKALAGAIGKLPTLKHLYITKNNISQPVQKELQAAAPTVYMEF